MAELKAIQNQLLSDVFSRQASDTFDPRGLEVYRANLRATAIQALKITFPTVGKLVGESMMAHAAVELLALSPPNHGDWAKWGEAFPGLLSTLPGLTDYPFVADVARLDFHCHQMVRAADTHVDFGSLMLLKSHLPEETSLSLNPQLVLMQSDYPIAEIRQAHQQNSDLHTQALKNAMQSEADQYYLACYRNGLEVLVRSLSAVEFEWLNALQKMTLGDALTQFQRTEFSFQQWLANALQTSLLHSVQIHV